MLASVKSMALQGLDGYLMQVEVDVSGGLPAWEIVGLADTAIKESKERIRIAIKNSGLNFPSKRIIVNLAPADIKKEGTFLDLPIAVGILIAIEKINNFNLEETVLIGELSLDGKIGKVNGVLPICIEAVNLGIKRIILPKENINEATIVKGIDIIPVENIKQVVDYLNGDINILPMEFEDDNSNKKQDKYDFDFSEVKGQENIKRALEVAAARST